MTYPYRNPPAAEHGDLYGAISHRLADQAKDPRNAEPSETHRTARAQMLTQAKRFISDALWRASLSGSQVDYYLGVIRWLRAQGDLPADLGMDTDIEGAA